MAAAADATNAQRRFAAEDDDICLRQLHAEGVHVATPEGIDIAAFQRAAG
jgi:hypothetical protein